MEQRKFLKFALMTLVVGLIAVGCTAMEGEPPSTPTEDQMTSSPTVATTSSPTAATTATESPTATVTAMEQGDDGDDDSFVLMFDCYRIAMVDMMANEDGTSTWQYEVEELECAQDLSYWVLELPDCVSVVSASGEYEMVDPDPNTDLTGIKWQTGAGFESGTFEVTLDAQYEMGDVQAAVKGPDVAYGEIAGPGCEVEDGAEDDDDDFDEVEFTGVVEAVNEDGSYVIDGRTVHTDHETEFDPRMDAVTVCARVYVEAYRQPDGTLVAIEIEVEEDDDYDDDDFDEIEFSGMVEAVNEDGSYVVDGWTVYTDHDTEFDPRMDAVMVDVWVYVEAYRQPGGTLLATEIEVEEDYQEIEFSGMVEAVNEDGSYVVDGWTVHTDHDTEFDPGMDAVMVDVWVYVEAYRQPGGTLLATEIEVEEDDDYDDDDFDEIEFSGMVEAVNEDGSYVVDGWTVHTDHDTEFDPRMDAVMVGVKVYVEAYRQPGGTLLATEIEVEEDYQEIEFSGMVEAVNDDSYAVDGWTVYVDDNTEFDPHRGAVMLCVRAYVEAYRKPGGTLLATEIEVEEDDD